MEIILHIYLQTHLIELVVLLLIGSSRWRLIPFILIVFFVHRVLLGKFLDLYFVA
jgi:hypothetical protein